MATVQINDRMLSRTTDRMRRFRDRRLENVLRKFTDVMPPFGRDIYDTLVGQEFADLVSRLPDGMFNTGSKLVIGKIGGHDIRVELPMGGERVRPMGTVAFAGGSMSSNYQGISVYLNDEHPDWADYVEPARLLEERRAKIRADHTKLESFVCILLNNWKSLGPCLKAWPAVWDLLDQDDKVRQGGRPKGTANDVPTWIGDAEMVKWATAMVTQIKLLGV